MYGLGKINKRSSRFMYIRDWNYMVIGICYMVQKDGEKKYVDKS